MWNNSTGATYSPELVKETAAQLMDAVKEGYGGGIGADFDTPDHLMLEKLTENVFHFSGAKTWHELNDITLALRGDDGKLRTFAEFRDRVQELGHRYNVEWLEAEYDTAVSSAQSAARWVDFKAEADIMPWLIYRTVGDDRVRSEHRPLDGITRRHDDDFWKTYYPPNGWRCRCDVEQVPESYAEETLGPTSLPKLPRMFRGNMAEQGIVFPKGHPYYNGVPKDVLRRSMQYLPPEYAYRTKSVTSMGRDASNPMAPTFQEHAMLQHEPEAVANRQIAQTLANDGKQVQLLPQLHTKESDLRRLYYGDDYAAKHATKCPDAVIDGQITEFKHTGFRNMGRRVHEAAQQADAVLLKLTENVTEDYLNSRFIPGQWNMTDRVNIKRIYVMQPDGTLHTFDRSE